MPDESDQKDRPDGSSGRERRILDTGQQSRLSWRSWFAIGVATGIPLGIYFQMLLEMMLFE